MTQVTATKIHGLTGHTDCVYTLQQADLPNTFFSGAGDGMIVLWDITKPETGELVARLPNSVYALHYIKDNDLLVVGHNYDGIHLLDWRQKKELKSLQLGNAAIFDIQSFGKDLFVAMGDGTVFIIDKDHLTIRKRISSSDKSARTIAINPLEGELAVGYSDHKIRVFGLEDFELRYEWTAHQNSVFTIVYSPDFKMLLSGSRDARLKSWQVGDHYNLFQEVVAHLYAINNIAFSPDGKHFVTCSLDKSIKVWEAGEMKLLKVIDKTRHAGHGTSVNKLLWTSFNNNLVSASDDRTISVWEIEFESFYPFTLPLLAFCGFIF